MTAILVIDVGTTTIRAAVVDEQLQIVALAHRSSPPSTPAPGLVEFDPVAMYDIVTDACQEVLSNVGEPAGVLGITNQRASTVVWERSTGEPIAPALGWQDLRTVMECIMAKAEHDLALAPNQPATKVPWLLDHVEGARRARRVLRHRRDLAGVEAERGRAARDGPHERRRVGADDARRLAVGRRARSTFSAFRRPCCRQWSTPVA